MPCYSPLDAWRLRFDTKLDLPKITFSSRLASDYPSHYEPLKLPCGKCVGCRLDYSRQWAVRCVHEASLYPPNMSWYVTFTYDDAHLPFSKDFIPTLNRRDFTLFMKRLRKAYPQYKIRYFYAGEYGEKGGRPHYHAILFNINFGELDADPLRPFNKHGQPLYWSEDLERIWGLGHVTIGTVNFESCAYVARYIMKKQLGKDNDYQEDVTYRYRVKEFTGMSRRPGIGHDWFLKYGMSDIYNQGYASIHKGEKIIRLKPPKFYDKLVEKYSGSDLLEAFKTDRRAKAKFDAEIHPERYTREYLLKELNYYNELTKRIERSSI